jgi:fatty-acyl-CoA synthase
MEGYYKDPEATSRAMGDGWFHSGDAAVVRPDGYVEIRDRLKDVIISGGENISSVEVEAALLRHPSVQEVAIVGLPNERWGEAPHGVTFVRELPKTATGKIQKYVLRRGAPNLAAQ